MYDVRITQQCNALNLPAMWKKKNYLIFLVFCRASSCPRFFSSINSICIYFIARYVIFAFFVVLFFHDSKLIFCCSREKSNNRVYVCGWPVVLCLYFQFQWAQQSLYNLLHDNLFFVFFSFCCDCFPRLQIEWPHKSSALIVCIRVQCFPVVTLIHSSFALRNVIISRNCEQRKWNVVTVILVHFR